MKKMKKVLALILAMAMVMGMGLTTFAKNAGSDQVYGTADDRGSISVAGITYEETITVTAYQIIEATYDQTNRNFTGYNPLYTGISLDPTTNEYTVTQDVVNSILADIRGDNQSVTPRPYSMTHDAGTGYYTAEDVPVGTYLVVIENADTKVYNPVVVSTKYIITDGQNDVEDKTYDIESSTAWVKVSSVPDVIKEIENGETDVKGNAVDIGDEVTYNVTIDPIPNYVGDYPVLNVVDILSEGLTYKENSLTVKVVDDSASPNTEIPLASGTDYQFARNGQELTVDFVLPGTGYTLNEHHGRKVIISYTVTVNSKAAVNESGNNNNVTLNYTTDSKTNGNDDTDTDKTYTYTFDIDGATTGTKDIITKIGEGNESNALPNAIFGLYLDSNCQVPYTNGSGSLTKAEGLSEAANTVTSDSTGQLYIKGLGEGTYFLKELAAPGGYSVNTHVFTIVISAEYNTDGTLKEWTVMIDNAETAKFTVTHGSTGSDMSDNIATNPGIDIKNTKLSDLPSTGGIGTTIFTVGGCIIMIAAAALFFMNRRKSEE